MKSLVLGILIVFVGFSFKSHSETTTCNYTVKKGEWVAKILRDHGSKNPFKDKSYFKTLKLNSENKSINKLSAGDVIKLPKSFLSQNAVNELCGKTKTYQVSKKNKVKTYKRKPASIYDIKNNKIMEKEGFKPRRATSKKAVNDDSFPILEYDALEPAGGAK